MNSKFFFPEFKKLSDFGTKKISIIIYLLIAILSLDTVLNQLSEVITEPLKSPIGISLFIIVSGITMICQLFVLQFVGRKSVALRRKLEASN